MNKATRFVTVSTVSLLVLAACGGDSGRQEAAGSSAVLGESQSRIGTPPDGLAATFDYEPQLPVPAVELPGAGTLVGGTITEVSLTAVDGATISATLTTPAGRGPFPTVMLQHGLGGRRQDVSQFHQTFTDLGFATVAIDVRGHGSLSTPEQLPTALAAGAPARDLFVNSVRDLRQTIDFLKSRAEIDANRIGYIGFSLGGILGADFAAADDRIKAVALVGAGADWSSILSGTDIDWIRELRANDASFVERAAQALNVVDPKWWVGSIAPRPVLVIRGDRDEIVPVDSTEVLLEAGGSNVEVVTYRGGHTPTGRNDTEMRRALTGFMTTHLGAESVATTADSAVIRP